MMVSAFVFGLFAALVGGWCIAAFDLRQPRGTPRTLAAALLGWAWATVGMQALGTLGLLRAEWLAAWSLAALLYGLSSAYRGRNQNRSAEPAREVEPTGWEGWLAVGLAIWAVLVLGMPSLLYPVKVVSDGPIYHLYFAARWWKAHELILVASPFGESAATYFPANGDLWFAWLMTLWGGDRLAKVGQAPFLLMACVAAYGCARELGAGRTASLVATSLFATGGPLILFSFEANVDTIFTAGYLTSAYFLLRYALQKDGWPALLLGGLAAGEALGTKTVGNLFVPPLVLAGGWAVIRRREGAAIAARMVATLLAGVAATSAFWFVRNAWLTGNPLYPLNVRVGGTTAFAGWYGPKAMESSPYYLPVANWRALGDILAGVLDARSAPLWLAAILGAWAIGRPRRPGDGWAWAFAAGAVLNVALYWLFIPYRTQQRFMLQGVGLAVVTLALLLGRGRWLTIATTLILAIHVLTPQAWPFGQTGATQAEREAAVPWDLTPLIPNSVGSIVPLTERLRQLGSPGGPMSLAELVAQGGVAGLAVWFLARLRRRAGLATTSAVGFAALALAAFLGYLQVSPFAGDQRLLFFPAFRDFYRGWMELDGRSGPAGSRVAYAGTNIPYYLMGVGLRNEVRYVNVDGRPDWQMHDYHRRALAEGRGEWPNSRPGWDREKPDYDGWLANLRAEGIQFLVATRVNPAEGAHNVADAEGFPIERVWADAHHDVFEPLYGDQEGDPWFRLYRVRQAAPPGRPGG